MATFIQSVKCAMNALDSTSQEAVVSSCLQPDLSQAFSPQIQPHPIGGPEEGVIMSPEILGDGWSGFIKPSVQDLQ